MDGYDEVDAIESFDDLELADEAAFSFRPGRRVHVAGGLSTATLHTPKGPAKLNLPSPVPTLTQFRTLEAALNSNTQRVNAVHAELTRVRRELALRRKDPQGGMSTLLFSLMGQRKLREDLDGHTHSANNTKPTFPTSTGGGSSSFLPFLLLQPGIFGQSGTGNSPSGGQDGMSSMLMMFVLMDLL
jgi:hypothetical protein